MTKNSSASGAELTTVIFDIGNVLVQWDPRNLYRQHFEDKEEMEYFLRDVTSPKWNLEQDRGRSFAEATALASVEFPHYADKIKLFDSNWLEMIGGEISGSVAILKQLCAEGVPVFAITNFSAEKWPIFCDQYDFTKLFQGVVVSGAEGLVKPDPAIYRLSFHRFAVAPQDCIFIDDRLENVEAARELGTAGHHFTDASFLETDLKTRGFLR
jgi:FMN phosphatase YigB (HAD superfamily)